MVVAVLAEASDNLSASIVPTSVNTDVAIPPSLLSLKFTINPGNPHRFFDDLPYGFTVGAIVTVAVLRKPWRFDVFHDLIHHAAASVNTDLATHLATPNSLVICQGERQGPKPLPNRMADN